MSKDELRRKRDLKPTPSFEWVITTKCNYACSYCCSNINDVKSGKHCSPEIIESVYKIIDNLPGHWLIKVNGGEAMIHPNFFSIIDRIAQNGHKLCLTTNFSMPLNHYKKIVEKFGENLEFLGASLHFGQVENIDDFIQKAIDFQGLKNPKTNFFVTSVLIENKLSILKEIAAKFEDKGITFSLQHLLVDGEFYEYKNQEAKQFLESRLLENTAKIRNKSFFRTLCHTGNLFYLINVQGKIRRCYNQQVLYWLGDLRKADFKPLSKPMPCLSPRCTCTVAVNRGMILFGRKANIIQTIQAYCEGIKRYRLLKFNDSIILKFFRRT